MGDGTSVYLYGLGRIGEEGAAGWLYHLGDALGSVRQLAAGDGEVVLDRSYRPYGGVLDGGGSGGSAYCFAGESTAKHSIFRYSSRWWAAFHLWFERATFFPSVGGNWTDIGPSYGEQVTADQCRVKCRESDTEYLGTRCTAVLRYGPYISDFTSNIQEGVMSVHDFEEIVLKIDDMFRSCMESHTEN